MPKQSIAQKGCEAINEALSSEEAGKKKKKSSWTEEEDRLIKTHVQHRGNKNWSNCTGLLPEQIGKQCREG